MLVLSRRIEQSFWVGEETRITILGIDRGRVKIGIEAPSHVDIQRGELRSDQSSPLSREHA